MEQVYHWIGLIIFWTSGLLGVIALIMYLSNLIVKKAADTGKAYWFLLEYVWYRKKFAEWVKDQRRHPKVDESESL